MNTFDYGKSMETKLIAWKAKISDLTQKSQTVDLKKERIFCATPKT